MKRLKAFLITMAAAAVISAGTFSVSAEVYGGSLDYILCGDEAVITGFEGNPEVLDLPEEIEGRKVAEIRENAFYRCDSLKKVIIPKSVKKIGHHAFYECRFLESAEICGNINTIDEGTFCGCSALVSVSLPGDLDSVGDYSFYGCGNLKEIIIPDSVTKIGEYAFADCKMLSGVYLPESLVEIDAYAFLRCSSLYNITVPDGVMRIGNCSLGFVGTNTLVPIEDFVITGNENALGQNYAQQNNMKFECKNINNVPAEKNSLWFPGILIVISGTGLLILKFMGRAINFEMKYEYEM